MMGTDITHNADDLKTFIIETQYTVDTLKLNGTPSVIGLELLKPDEIAMLQFVFSWETEQARQDFHKSQIACVMKSDVIVWEEIVQLLDTIQSAKCI